MLLLPLATLVSSGSISRFEASNFSPKFCFLRKKRLNSLPKRFVVYNIFLVKIGKVFFLFFSFLKYHKSLFRVRKSICFDRIFQELIP